MGIEASRTRPANASTNPIVARGSRIRRAALAALATLAVVATALVVAPPAAADGPTARVMVRTQRMADAHLSSGQDGWYERGAVITLDCYKRGQPVKGYFSPYLPNGGWDDLWYRVSDGRFVADVDIETGSTNPVTAPCPVPFDAAPAPTIDGAVVVDSTLSANTGGWSPAADFTYQWNLDGQPVGGATAQSWLLPDTALGKSVTVTVTGQRSGYITAVVTSAPTTAVTAATLTTVTPTISGTPTIGSDVTAVPGDWAPQPVTYSYAWLRNNKAIAGATAASYRLTSADAGAAISVSVTGSRPGYTTASLTSASISVGRALTATPTPTINGTAVVGSKLTATAGGWKPEPVVLKYFWSRNGTAIAGASAATYTLVPADSGAKITVTVTGSKSGYSSASKTSSAVTIERILTATPTPTVSGTPTVGATLSAKPGTWAPAPVAFAYQWLRNGKAISGATSSSYALTAADAGAAVSVKVTGYKNGYTPASKTSAAVTVGNALTKTPAPTISGTARRGSVLTAASGTWAPAPVAFAYSWLRDGTPIAGATTSSYRVTDADTGRVITVRVTGSKGGYTSVTTTSKGVTVEKLLTAAPTPTISGSPTEGATLSAKAGSWAPSPVTLSYQWMRGGKAISGATASTYRVTSGDVGSTITVVVTGSKTGYTPQSRTSLGVVIAKKLTTTPVPTIAGEPKVGATLTAKPGTWAPAPVTLGYQWFRDGAAIAKATTAKYVLVQADAGTAITVRVVGSKSGYTSASRTSAPVTVAPTTLTSADPAISGNAAVGGTLSADPGVWGPSPVDIAYQWFIDGGPVGGATGNTFGIPFSAAGRSITVTVTGSKAGYASVSRSSGAVQVSRNVGDTMTPGNVLPPDIALTSASGQYRFVLQSDGNLVISRDGAPIWGSRTDGNQPAYLAFQTDGNLVLYRSDGRAIWETRTWGKAARNLVMQNDGNLVLYGTNGGALWASGTGGGGGGGGDGRLIVPFAPGQTMYVCQGYNGGITHSGDPALDLTSYSGRGSTGCWGGANDAAGKTVYAPGGGNLAQVSNEVGGVCITLDGGGSVYLGHLENRRGNGRVNQGDPIGTIAPAGAAGNGGYAHMHFSARTGSGCGGTKVPFTSANNMKIAGVGELPYNGSVNQWAGTSMRR